MRPIDCFSGIYTKIPAPNGTTVKISRGSLNRVECVVNSTVYSMLHFEDTNDVTHSEVHKDKDTITDITTYVFFFRVNVSGWIVLDALNRTGENTDYLHMLFYQGESSNKIQYSVCRGSPNSNML